MNTGNHNKPDPRKIRAIREGLAKWSSNFWTLQITGWSLYIIFSEFIHLGNRHYLSMHIVIWVALTNLIGFGVTVGYRYIFHHINYQRYSIPVLILLIGVLTIIGANVWWIADKGLDQIIALPTDQVVPTTLRYYFEYFYLWGIVLFAWCTLYIGLNFWNEWARQKETTEHANILAHQAQLQMLRYQINPHFLFNTLNAIRALVEENEKQAREMITELAEFLRYSLISSQYNDVPLSEEIDAIRHYFAIEKRRYENKLEVSIDIDPLAEDFPVLSFLVHPLVENAIRYGMHSSPIPLCISITARVSNNTLGIEVYNTGKWSEPIPGKNGISTNGDPLKNVRERLANAYPGRHHFEIIERKDGVCVRIEISQPFVPQAVNLEEA